MTVAFRAVATATSTAANPITVGKPTGLAVGDLMVYITMSQTAYLSGDPSGFTNVAGATGYSSDRYMKVWQKVATQTDVDATAFTVANAGSRKTSTALYAISGAGTVEYADLGIGLTTPYTASVTGFTPMVTGDIIIWADQQDGSDTPTAATANNNPSWTADFTDNTWYNYRSGHAAYTTGVTGAITVSGTRPKVVSFLAIGSAPTVTSLSVATGLTTGGTSVTITGTSLTGATAVKFGTTDAASFSVTNSTTIACSSPAHAVGTVDITVITPGGTTATGAGDQFTYTSAFVPRMGLMGVG